MQIPFSSSDREIRNPPLASAVLTTQKLGTRVATLLAAEWYKEITCGRRLEAAPMAGREG
jgi:hypothetical protein